MILRRSTDRLPPGLRGAAVAIGNFDGVHPGHRAVITAARTAARVAGRPLAVLTFEPHPRRLFRPDAPPFRLTPLRAKLDQLAGLGVDLVVAQRFNRAFAASEPDAFVRRLLVEGLAAHHVAVGHDFCYGRARGGDVASLVESGRRLGFAVAVVDAVADADGRPYASTRVREALAQGDMAQAAAALGRPFAIEGRVRVGARLGRTIGFPTANIALGPWFRPRLGVYAVRVAGVSERSLAGVANIGRRPSVDGADERLEAHLFDFDGDLYGRRLSVELHLHLRDERRFDGLAALTAQIARDAADARRALGV
jgi:riboflavin kinase/FMN adenylyltransferase